MAPYENSQVKKDFEAILASYKKLGLLNTVKEFHISNQWRSTICISLLAGSILATFIANFFFPRISALFFYIGMLPTGMLYINSIGKFLVKSNLKGMEIRNIFFDNRKYLECRKLIFLKNTGINTLERWQQVGQLMAIRIEEGKLRNSLPTYIGYGVIGALAFPFYNKWVDRVISTNTKTQEIWVWMLFFTLASAVIIFHLNLIFDIFKTKDKSLREILSWIKEAELHYTSRQYWTAPLRVERFPA